MKNLTCCFVVPLYITQTDKQHQKKEKMVTLSAVQSSNSRISSTLPANLVAVFIGGTSGIGEISVKKFAKYTIKPRVYIVGRSQEAADRIIAECRALNSGGEYIFMKADVSLIRGVDDLCEKIKAKEKTINLLMLAAAVVSLDRSKTSEGLHLLAALTYYCRIRTIINVLPLLNKATDLRRVIIVGGGSNEGQIDPTDFPALRVPLRAIRGHLITLITLGLESVAKDNPDISFIHDYPGYVKTNLFARMRSWTGYLMRAFVWLIGSFTEVPIEECGERHVFLATSARYPAANGTSGVPLVGGIEVAESTAGAGIYSIGWDCESASPAVMNLLANYRKDGMVEKLWKHTESEFKRITEQNVDV
ncbi:hypothetical protein B7494_g2945 [Chlorociboria aeruginascens]|nr:hypothetical protein B7494_g2945 [Chlorociboria aeruginascens]